MEKWLSVLLLVMALLVVLTPMIRRWLDRDR